MYSEKVLQIFKKPKHVGEMEKADAIGEVGNPVCGDMMKLYLKVEDNVIKDVKIRTYGCVAAIASSDTVAEKAIGKTLDQALKMTKQEIVDELGGLPPQKVHCSILAIDALKKAIEDYRQKAKK
jgi:nitrogen fixation NifU-like protein